MNGAQAGQRLAAAAKRLLRCSAFGSAHHQQEMLSSLPPGARAFTGSSGCSGAPYSYSPPGRNHLFVPGPVNIHDRVLRAMDRPSLNHRDPWYPPFFTGILEDLKMIFATKQGTTFIYPGTGTGGWESALQNTLSPGDKVVTFRYGQFSHLWVDMMKRLGLDVTVIECPWGEGADEARLDAVLKADTDKKIKAVCVVHNETTTGVTSDIKGVREVIDSHSHPALLLVDGVSSIGALNFQMDEWKVDVAVTGSQKALSLPTGLGLLCVSPKALEAQKTAKLKRCYYDWADMLATNPSGNVPYTPSIPLLYGLKESLTLLRDEGMANVVARHHRLAEGTRKAVEGWGLKLLCKQKRWQSDSLTVIETPEGFNSNLIVKNAYARYNLSIGVGLSEVAGKVFRIGHLGNSDEVMQASALAGTEMALISSGLKITPGSGVGRAIEYWASTSKIIPTREFT